MRSKPLEGTNLGDRPEHESLIGNMRTMGDKHDEEDNDEEELAAVAHYVMTHYAEREVIKKRRSISQNLGSTS